MRFRKLFALFIFLLAGSLLAPVKAETSYYAVSFDGDDYAEVKFANPIDIDEVTYVVLFNDPEWGGNERYLEGYSSDSYTIFLLHSLAWTNDDLLNEHYDVNGRFPNVWIAAGTFRGAPHLVAVTYVNDFSTNTTTVKGYLDGVLVNERVVDAPKGRNLATLYIPKYASAKYYLVLIYNRALSDSEIQAIYENPNDPPRAGLILWYAPDSVDTVNGLWRDKSENGNDGTIVGATAERVSIIRVRDYKTNADITLKSTITNLDTGETLFQPLPIVDYNTPTTIKVEAQGYKTQIIKLGGFKPLYTVYMQPLLTELQIKFNVANYFPTAMWFLVAGVMGSIVAGIFSMSDRVGRKAKVVIVIVLGLIFFIYMLQFAL